MPKNKTAKAKQIETLTHKDAGRVNIPTAEYESLLDDRDKNPVAVTYARRNPDLDPQLVWRGKDEQDVSDLLVQAPPLYIQEKLHPKVLIDDLKHQGDKGDRPSGETVLLAGILISRSVPFCMGNFQKQRP